MPPLRERRGEIAHLLGFFMDRYARRYNRPVRQLSAELTQLFQTYEWPGNIRELENMIKRIVILQDEQLVIREITRAARPVAAYATAGASVQCAGIAPAPTTGRAEELDRTTTSRQPEEPVGRRRLDRGSPMSRRRPPSRPSGRSSKTRSSRSIGTAGARLNSSGVSYKTLLNKIKECGISRK